MFRLAFDMIRRALPILSVGSIFLLPGAGAAQAEELQPKPGRTWALLIGVEKYRHMPRLRYTINDVTELADTLMKHGGIDREGILKIVDQPGDSDQGPTHANLRTKLSAFLQRPGQQDRVIVYFSGHGTRDAQKRTYLAPIDCDPADLAATGLAIEWLRDQLVGCRAEFKLLVIDACHAGFDKGPVDPHAVSSEELGRPFEDVKGVVTLASSTSDQLSQLWPERRQSLFTYWLNHALKGHADIDGDGAVDIHELYKYVSDNVTVVSEGRLGRKQTPVRIVGVDVHGVPDVLQLQPQSLQQVLGEMSLMLSEAMIDRRYKNVGVLEFSALSSLEQPILGGDFGLLGRYCAGQIEEQLGRSGENAGFTVADGEIVREEAKKQQFSPKTLLNAKSRQSFGEALGGVQALAVGMLRQRNGSRLFLECKLIEVDGNVSFARTSGVAEITPKEWAMLPRSVIVQAADYQTTVAPTIDRPSLDNESKVVERLDKRTEEEPHPLLNPQSPFRVRILVDDRERKPVFRGRECYIGLGKGESFRIEIGCARDEITLLRLLVDGLNTLPEVMLSSTETPAAPNPSGISTRGRVVASERTAKGLLQERWAPRVDLPEARHWELDPNRTPRKLWGIGGFTTTVGDGHGTWRKFVVAEAAESLAVRQGYGDQVGIITAAFYAPAPGARSIGVVAGPEERVRMQMASGARPGNLLSVIQIRYVEPAILQKLGH